MSSTRRVFREALSWAASLAVLAVSGLVLLGSEGPVRSRLAARAEANDIKRLLQTEWDALTGSGTIATNESAPAVVVFSDYQCPYCRRVHPMLQEAVRSGAIQLYMRHLPLPIHEHAHAAAVAAVCAEGQGHLAQLNHHLLSTSEWEANGDMSVVAQTVGIPDIAAFEACIAGRGATERIEADMQLARKLGVSGTPTFIINHKIHVGALDEVTLSSLLR